MPAIDPRSIPTWKVYMKNGNPLLAGGPTKNIAKECCCCDYPTIVVTVTAPSDAQLPVTFCGFHWVKSVGGGGPALLGTKQRRNGESAEVCPTAFSCGDMGPAQPYPPTSFSQDMATGIGDVLLYAPGFKMRRWGILSIYDYWGPPATGLGPAVSNTLGQPYWRVGVFGSIYGNPGIPYIYTPWKGMMHNTLSIIVETKDTSKPLTVQQERRDFQYFVRVPLVSGIPAIGSYFPNGAWNELNIIAKQACTFGCSTWLTSSQRPLRIRGSGNQIAPTTTGGGRTFKITTGFTSLGAPIIKTYTTGGGGAIPSRSWTYDFAGGFNQDWFGSHTDLLGTIYTWERGRGWENNAGCSNW